MIPKYGYKWFDNLATAILVDEYLVKLIIDFAMFYISHNFGLLRIP